MKYTQHKKAKKRKRKRTSHAHVLNLAFTHTQWRAVRLQNFLAEEPFFKLLSQ